MARYTGPRRKLERRQQATLFGSNAWEKRPGMPGQHPFTRSRPTGYSIQLREVQKVKRMYGLLEKQFSNLVKRAQKSTGNTGTTLLQLLESRLDNVVFRMNWANTRAQARQFVNHGHVKVNGKKVDIPSFKVNPGDKIELSSKLKTTAQWEVIKADTEEKEVAEWVAVDSKEVGTFVELPVRSKLDQNINERLIIEFYSR